MTESKFQIPDGPEINIRQDGMLTNLGLDSSVTDEAVAGFITAVASAIVELRINPNDFTRWSDDLVDLVEQAVEELLGLPDTLPGVAGGQTLRLLPALRATVYYQQNHARPIDLSRRAGPE